jgi:asparagine synthase (glutamine-hydrolysing)
MTNSLLHRGPNDGDVWINDNCEMALGHRRLSILDLSSQGHQPMSSESGRFLITYNGEIYNYLEIRRELERDHLVSSFRGNSDTEVILAAIEGWGIERAVSKFNGIFAFALWDEKERELCMVRDRVGVKPLYYGWAGKSLIFASELKALKKHPHFNREINETAVSMYFNHNYIPAPYSIFKGTFKLLPGHIIRFGIAGNSPDKSRPLPSEPYWSAEDLWIQGALNPLQCEEIEAVDQLEKLMSDAVRLQMVSDVPLGAFLSGGIDSSIVTSLMQSHSQRPIKTYSIGFLENGYNEAAYAKKVANFLGTDHVELYVTDKQAQDVIPLITGMYDEPFADSSQIPTFLVSKLAKSNVTVALSGDGGDELFSGYGRYTHANKIWTDLSYLPNSLKKVAHSGIRCLPTTVLDTLGYPLNPLLKILGYRPGRIGERLKRYSNILSLQTREQVYHSVVSYSGSQDNPAVRPVEPMSLFFQECASHAALDYFQLMSLWDLITYLPDDILVKVDRASMSVALEARVPILDHHIIEFSASLPTAMKIKSGSGKWVLKQVLERYLPVELTSRPKMGFGVPIEKWLTGTLRGWAENLIEQIDEASLGLLNTSLIKRLWNEHCSGQYNWSYKLWGILMFQSWLREQQHE